MGEIRGIIFDYDGALADSVKAHNVARILAFKELGYGNVDPRLHDEAHRHGTHPPEIIGWVLKQAKIIPPTTDVLTDTLVQNIVGLKKDIFRRESADGLDANPGAVEFVNKAYDTYGKER